MGIHFLAPRLYSEGPALQICNASHPPSVAGQESEREWKFFPILIVLVGHTGLLNPCPGYATGPQVTFLYPNLVHICTNHKNTSAIIVQCASVPVCLGAKRTRRKK